MTVVDTKKCYFIELVFPDEYNIKEIETLKNYAAIQNAVFEIDAPFIFFLFTYLFGRASSGIHESITVLPQGRKFIRVALLRHVSTAVVQSQVIVLLTNSVMYSAFCFCVRF